MRIKVIFFGYRYQLLVLVTFVILVYVYVNLRFVQEHVQECQSAQQTPVIYIITPTVSTFEQKADLTRLSHTLRLVENVHWIVVEDSNTKTTMVANLLKESGLRYTHLNSPTDKHAKRFDNGVLISRGVVQRNEGLNWLRNNTYHSSTNGGVVYFADDDNTYSLRIFEEMRSTKKVSVWPVGLVGHLRFETPIVKNGKVVGWFAWSPTRSFAIDMCGFSVNLKLILDFPNVRFKSIKGELESHFLSSLNITLDDLEPKAKLCTEILVWHTRTERSIVEKNNVDKSIYIREGTLNTEELKNVIRKSQSSIEV